MFREVSRSRKTLGINNSEGRTQRRTKKRNRNWRISRREWRKCCEYNCNKNPRDLQQVWDTGRRSVLDGKRREIEDLWNIGNTLGKYWISWKRWDMEKRKKPGRVLARNTRIGRLPTRINIEFEKCRDTGNPVHAQLLWRIFPRISWGRKDIYFQNSD